MKKLFTLIAAALFAVSASAKEEVALPSPWGASVTLEGNTYSIGGGYQGAGTSMGENDDKTAFDYVYIKYSGATGSPSFAIVYNEWKSTESWGESFQTVSSPIPDGAGTVGIKLDKETIMQYGSAKEGGTGIGDVYAKHVQQIQLQSGNAAATVTVEGIWFGTTAEYAADGGDVPVRPAYGESLVIWEGEHVYGSGWSDTDVFAAKYFDVAKVGDIIRCSFKDGNDPNPVFKIVSTWEDLADVQETREVTETYFQGTIATEAALTELKKNGLRLQGVNFTLTKVELINNVKEDEGGEESATPVSISWGADDIAEAGTLNGKTFGEDFKLTITDTTDDGKVAIDANNAYFGDATTQTKFTHRLKTGGKSSSKNAMTLTIPSTGTLKVYVRTGSNSAKDRTLVLTQSGTELYNKIVQEADAIQVKGLDEKDPEKETNVYPIISVPVAAGTVDITYPVNGMNFYGFEFVSGTTGIETVIPVKAIENGAIYNLAGQKVNETYKGIVIKNGKKYIQK